MSKKGWAIQKEREKEKEGAKIALLHKPPTLYLSLAAKNRKKVLFGEKGASCKNVSFMRAYLLHACSVFSMEEL